MAVESPVEVLPQLRFRLPGRWAQIPLHNRDEARAAIRRLVSTQIGNADEAATVRADLRRQFEAALAEAIDGEGQSMQVAIEIIEKLPTPASFTVFLPAQRLTPAVGTTPEAVMAVLDQALADRGDVGIETASRFTAGESEVLRAHRYQFVPTTEGEVDLRVLVVDYWMTVPGTKRVILVNFHTALADLEQQMLVLFDSIVRATYWQRPEPLLAD